MRLSALKNASTMDELEEYFSALFDLGSKAVRDWEIGKGRLIESATSQLSSASPDELQALTAQAIAYEFSTPDYSTALPTEIGKIGMKKLVSLGGNFSSAVRQRDIEQHAQSKVEIVRLDDEIKELVKPVRDEFLSRQRVIIESAEYQELGKKLRAQMGEEYKIFQAKADEVSDELSFKERKSAFKKIEREYNTLITDLINKNHEEENKLLAPVTDWYKEESAKLTDEKASAKAKAVSTLEHAAEQMHVAVSGALLAASPVSDDDAQNWVRNNVYVEKEAIKRIANSKQYKNIDEFYADVAQFYRYVGGKLVSLNFKCVKGKNRAHTTESSPTIFVDKDIDKTTLFHEMAHRLEFENFVANKSAIAFVRKRTAGERLRSLKSLTGVAYGRGERARPDHFYNPYVGKEYPAGSKATELLSMGLQQLATPKQLAALYTKDKEHLDFALGVAGQNDTVTQQRFVLEQKFAAQDVKLSEQAEKLRTAIDKVIKPKMMVKYADQISTYRSKYVVETSQSSPQLFSKINDARTFLYLCLASEQSLLPSKLSVMDCLGITDGSFVPEWFSPDFKFPKLTESK